MAITLKHATIADGTFSAAGATAWDEDHNGAFAGLTAGQIPFPSDANTLTDSALLSLAVTGSPVSGSLFTAGGTGINAGSAT